MQQALEYAEWRNFENVIQKAKIACEKSGNVEKNHFVDVNKIVEAGVTSKPLNDIMLSRYACYLIVQNGDPSKEVIALGQTYFAVKARQQELIENYDQLSEDQKRLAIRNEMIEHNKSLSDAARMAGVIEPLDYAIFQNKGYQGLYGGLRVITFHQLRHTHASLLRYLNIDEMSLCDIGSATPPKKIVSRLLISLTCLIRA